jgi:hypothetical protein
MIDKPRYKPKADYPEIAAFKWISQGFLEDDINGLSDAHSLKLVHLPGLTMKSTIALHLFHF